MSATDIHQGRRQFLIGIATVAGGLAIGFRLGSRRSARLQPNAFLRIDRDDRITVVIGKSEMGQGVYTSLPMIVAEELDVDPQRVTVELAPADPAFNSPFFPTQLTAGSTSVRTTFEPLRKTGATARALLVAAAAQEWDVDPASLRTVDGTVTDGARSLRYGELVETAARLPVPADVPLKDPKDFRYIGTSVRRLDTPEKICGRARFGLDIRRPDMLFATVVRAPVFGARVTGFDDSAARAVPGVIEVRQVPSGVAVIAKDTYTALKARKALKVQWDLSPAASLSTDALREEYIRLSSTPGNVALKQGDAEGVLAASRRLIEAVYVLPYLAHACMEPLNCVVHVTANRCDIWTGTQWQSEDVNRAAKALGFRPEQVAIHTQFLGGGFGRRANPESDFVVEAVHVARGLGRPVQTVWTREDDMRGGWYRPFFVHRVRGALGPSGEPLAWRHTIVGQSIFASNEMVAPLIVNGIDPSSVEGVTDMPYQIPHVHVDLHSPVQAVPVQWWRSVGHSHTAFAVNSFIDELAAAAGRDPYELRRALLAGKPRHLAVLDTAAREAGWGSPAPPGHFRGIALQECFGSIVAQVAEVSVDGAGVRVHRVLCAVDCGLAVHPGQIAAQMESGIVFGLSAALRGEITIENGRVQQSNFDGYSPLRIHEVPHIETHIVESGGPLGGIGEPGTPCIAPAVCGAIFGATGRRIRRLPVSAALT